MKQNLLLLHGAWHTADCWTDFAALAQPYFISIAPNLSGLSYMSAIEEILLNLKDVKGKIHILAHSFAGFYIPDLCQRCSQITSITYVNAFIPETGESLFSLCEQLDSKSLNPYLKIVDDCIHLDPQNPALDIMYRLSPRTNNIVAQSLSSFQTHVQLNPQYGNCPKQAIIAEHDEVLSPNDQLWMCARQGLKYHIIAGDHIAISSSKEQILEKLLFM